MFDMGLCREGRSGEGFPGRGSSIIKGMRLCVLLEKGHLCFRHTLANILEECGDGTQMGRAVRAMLGAYTVFSVIH